MAAALHVIEAGTGLTVVLVHGAMDRAAGMAKVARHLGDLHVMRYTRRGYSGSAALGPGDLDTHVTDLVDLLGELVPSPASARPVVAGHSFGGLVALGAARRVPGLVAAVGAFEPPTPWHPSWPPGIEEWVGDDADAVDLVIGRAVGAERWARAPEALRSARRAEGGAMMTEMRSLLGGPPGGLPVALGPLSCPARLARGATDRAAIGPGLADLAGRLGLAPPDLIEGAGHRAPATHARAYAGWVRSLSTWVRAPATVREH